MTTIELLESQLAALHSRANGLLKLYHGSHDQKKHGKRGAGTGRRIIRDRRGKGIARIKGGDLSKKLSPAPRSEALAGLGIIGAFRRAARDDLGSGSIQRNLGVNGRGGYTIKGRHSKSPWAFKADVQAKGFLGIGTSGNIKGNWTNKKTKETFSFNGKFNSKASAQQGISGLMHLIKSGAKKGELRTEIGRIKGFTTK